MIPLPKPQKYTAKLIGKEKISSKVYLEKFALVSPTEIAFLAGQTVMFHVAPGVNRSMSMASPPSETHSFIMAHDISPGGPYAQWAIGAKVGDQLTFMGPLGIFVLDQTTGRRKILVATGTGVAPFRSMLLDYLGKGGTDDVTLYWGLRHEEDIFWREELEALAATYPNFRFVLTLSRPSDAWHGKLGHVEAHIFEEEKNLPGADWYLCGNKLMVDEMHTKLLAAGVPEKQITRELFF